MHLFVKLFLYKFNIRKLLLLLLFFKFSNIFIAISSPIKFPLKQIDSNLFVVLNNNKKISSTFLKIFISFSLFFNEKNSFSFTKNLSFHSKLKK